MKNLIRLSWLVLLLGVLPGCAREKPSDTSTTRPTDLAVPAPQPEPSTDSVSPAPPEAPAPPPKPASTRTLPRKTAPSPTPAPATASEPAREPAPVPTSREARVEPSDSPNRTPRASSAEMQTVPAGTKLTVTMSDGVSTSTSKEGDTFNAAVTDPWIVDGRVVAERGDRVVGKVTDVVLPGKVKGRAQLTLVLTEISTLDRKHKIKTEPFVAIAVDNKERDAAIVAGGAGVGAAIGAITGGKKGAAIGAVIGGGGGTATVLATPGRAMKIEPETKVNFVLDNDVRLPIIRNRAD